MKKTIATAMLLVCSFAATASSNDGWKIEENFAPEAKKKQIQIAADKRKTHEEEAKEHMQKFVTDRAKFGHRILYSSDQAKKVVENFVMDCGNGKSLHLTSMLYASMRISDDGQKNDQNPLTQVFDVENRGQSVRIFMLYLDKNGKPYAYTPSQLRFVINEWGGPLEILCHSDKMIRKGMTNDPSLQF